MLTMSSIITSIDVDLDIRMISEVNAPHGRMLGHLLIH